ncbi:hypothetical protein FE697_003720 [Mumia zhuanghuii]|uniref:Uncharacterized protein n=2 Tax=Mumia TaxID=1546255 RepID=A0ABW1QP58_9ACTN|nr:MULTISPECIES: hypothetical protein [Mumia]KAA1425012.1 hypothetical protein FE697_003720 [Mumia zhuanghuii]
MRKTIMAALAVGVLGTIALTGTADAATTGAAQPAGTTFLGKGSVQTALGMNNAALQKAVDSNALTFSSKQDVSQALSQAGTQAGTQTATQSVSQDVSCTLNSNKIQFHRDGTREGVATGTREGTRAGERDGVVNGTVASSIVWDARKTGQWTGFWLSAPVVTGTTMGENEFGTDYSFGDYAFGDYAFGAVAYGDWTGTPTENPSVCLGGNPNVTDVENVITEGAITDGAITDGAITDGAISNVGDLVYGATTLLVNGKPIV